MSRVKVDWRSSSRANYKDFCSKHKDIKISYREWYKLVYTFNEKFRDKILQSGDRYRLPLGIGDFTIIKKKRKKVKEGGKINLPIDWKKTKESGKIIYNFNFHTEGYFFGWYWFKDTARFKHAYLWYFTPLRTSSRLITTYINLDTKYQHLYQEWVVK